MAQLAKWLAATPDNPSLSSRTLMVKESAKSCRLSSDLHITLHGRCALIHTYCTHKINKCSKGLVINEK